MIRRTLLMLLALALATAAACGGDDDSDDSADAPPETSETTEDATDDAATGDESGDGGEGDGSPGVGTELEVDREFTGEDSEPFCTQVRDVVTGTRDADSDAEVISDAEFADQMAAMDVPGEIADEWETLYTVQRAVAEDPDGDVFATMDPEESEDWAMAGAIVAAYLGDVCEISDDG
jgi:hypothetical protein